MLNFYLTYKKMKKENGMSHVTVFFTIVIMIIILVGGALLVKKLYFNEKLETLRTNLVTLQAKVKVVAEEVVVKKEGAEYVGKKLSENLEEESLTNLLNEGVISNEDEHFDSYYILENAEDYSKLKVKNLNGQKTIVNYATYEIIYVNGFIINNVTYYKLSDFSILDKKEENEICENAVNEEQIEETTEANNE